MDLGSNLKPVLYELRKEKKRDAEHVKVKGNKSVSDDVFIGKFSKIDDGRDDIVKSNGEIENGHTKSMCKDDREDIQSVDKDVHEQSGISSTNEKCHASDEDKSFKIVAFGKESVPVTDKVSDSIVIKEDVCCGKRKRKHVSDMLNWIYKVAQDPCDPAIGSLPESSQWKCYSTDNTWKQVLLIREELLLKRNVDSSNQHFTWQKKRRMHPTMYDDHTERLRCSQRILSAKDAVRKSRPSNISESSSCGNQRDQDYQDESPESTADSMPVYLSKTCHRQMRVFIGPEYQADVDEWNGKTFKDESKWSGTRIWPLGRVEHNKNLIKREPLGKGRPDSCGCRFPGSMECVGFHVSEKRNRLRLELGLAFYLWRFNRMGEETVVSWTQEEESKFHDTWKSNPLSMGCFWDEIVKVLPNKGRASLVSYYFNVFLLRRRGDQNRTTSFNINSDDDEEETDTESEADVKPPGSICCSPKKAKLKAR